MNNEAWKRFGILMKKCAILSKVKDFPPNLIISSSRSYASRKPRLAELGLFSNSNPAERLQNAENEAVINHRNQI